MVLEPEPIPLEDEPPPPAGGDQEPPTATVFDGATPASDLPSNDDAQRFARLLVSEIVLYNAADVTAGQREGNLYNRLKATIGRSREAYVDRFGSDLVVLFEEELIKTLANGDRALMGPSFS